MKKNRTFLIDNKSKEQYIELMLKSGSLEGFASRLRRLDFDGYEVTHIIDTISDSIPDSYDFDKSKDEYGNYTKY